MSMSSTEVRPATVDHVADGLRVGLVHWCMPPTTGGVESHLADLSRLLAEAGCQVTVITGEEAPTPIPRVEIVTTPLLNIERIRTGSHRGEDYPDRLRALFTEVVAERRLNVVHGHQLHHFEAEPALVLDLLHRQLGFGMHHTFHETWPDMLHDTPVYRGWHGMYAVSDFVRNECATRIGVQPALLRLGVDTAHFVADTSTDPADVPTIVHPARLMPWKGVHVSVRMLAHLRDNGVAARLVLTDTQRIADWNHELDDYRAHILALIRELGLGEQIEVVPASYAQMRALYQRADVVIYPTVEPEPFGLVPLEGMSMGRPVVASRIGGIQETVVDGETGFLVEPGDARALAERVAVLLRQPELRARMGVAGRARVLREFDLRRYVGVLLARYAASVRRVNENTRSAKLGGEESA
jgi:glycosyltransferase involved in cell wall biosynthesis